MSSTRSQATKHTAAIAIDMKKYLAWILEAQGVSSILQAQTDGGYGLIKGKHLCSTNLGIEVDPVVRRQYTIGIIRVGVVVVLLRLRINKG